MASRRDGNAAKRVVTSEPAPWKSWRVKSRHARAIRWIEEYFIPPKGFGAGRPLRLAEFQKAWLEEVYAPGVTAAAMELPRGNGKSTFLGAVGAHALFDEDDSGAPQVPIVATTVNQAVRSVYGVVLAAIAKHDALSERALVYSAIGAQRVRTPHNDGEMFPVSNDPDGLQGLDPSLAVCDEIGFMPIESWDSLLLASGKRPQSLVVGIGTPGFDRESALWHMRTRVKSGVELPGFRFVEYSAPEGCSVLDEAVWFSSNPALQEGYKDINAMRTAVALSPESHFRIFQLGQWVDGVESWLGVDGRKVWQSLADPWPMQLGADTWVGVDVAMKRDTTAVVWAQRRPDGRLHVEAKIWHPSSNEAIDVTDVQQFIRELGAMYRLRSVAYDNRFFDVPAKNLLDEGYPMLEFPQSLERMTPAVGATYEAIRRGELSHNGDEGFETQVLNAVARFNERGFILSKAKSETKGKIDAAVAMCMACAEAFLPDDAAAPVTVASPVNLGQQSYWRS